MIYHTFLLAAVTNLVGLISPGPDFAYVSKNSLLYGRRIGYFSAIGIALGLIIHGFICVFLLPYMVAQNKIFIDVIRYCGGSYLIYLSFLSFREFFFHHKNTAQRTNDPKVRHSFPSVKKTIISGFLCNVLNPKAYLFFISIYSALIANQASLKVRLLFAMNAIITATLWFSLVAVFFTNKKLVKKFFQGDEKEKYINLICGIAFLGFSIAILFFIR